MSQVLYRKYRPKTFSEVEGQEHIVRTLQGALLSDRIGHAYLFCGPRGTGKTTIARLLAKVLNCVNLQPKTQHSRLIITNRGSSTEASGLKPDLIEPCNKCHSCIEINEGRSMDLIEIDAASNRGIDEIRNIKDSAQVAAASSRYKIFIIDEVHMLTPPAFNALLKILEEPPAHIIFILATTEPHKVLDTVLSRVQKFDFKKISPAGIIEKLKREMRSEKISIEEPALAAIASFASGSLRDAESALNKLIAYAKDKITTADVSEILGFVPVQVHESLLVLISGKNSQEAVSQISKLYESGIDLEHFTKQFVKYLRSKLMESLRQAPVLTASGQSQYSPDFLIKMITVFMKAGSELKFSPIPQLPLELAILELAK